MIRKLVMSVSLALMTSAFCMAQAQSVETPESKAKKKSEVVAKFIDSKIVDAPKKLTAKQKADMQAAQLTYEKGMDSVKTAKAELPKRAEELKAKAAAIPAEVTEADLEKVNAQKEEVKKLQEALKADQAKLNERPEQLKAELEVNIKKALKGDQLKAYETMLAEQKKKKGN